MAGWMEKGRERDRYRTVSDSLHRPAAMDRQRLLSGIKRTTATCVKEGESIKTQKEEKKGRKEGYSTDDNEWTHSTRLQHANRHSSDIILTDSLLWELFFFIKNSIWEAQIIRTGWLERSAKVTRSTVEDKRQEILSSPCSQRSRKYESRRRHSHPCPRTQTATLDTLYGWEGPNLSSLSITATLANLWAHVRVRG